MPEYLNLSEALYYGVGQYEVPELMPIDEVPDIDRWEGFNNIVALARKPGTERVGIDFFQDDYKFERCWNFPNRYTETLKKFGAVLSPDFSMYGNFPKAVQIFNHYRRQWLGRYWQEHGLTVIPTASWSDESSFDWCFEGIPKNSIVAVSSVGLMKKKGEDKWFMDGYNALLKALEPKQILLFAKRPLNLEGPVTYFVYTGDGGYKKAEV